MTTGIELTTLCSAESRRAITKGQLAWRLALGTQGKRLRSTRFVAEEERFL
jgi:hypothetical protein